MAPTVFDALAIEIIRLAGFEGVRKGIRIVLKPAANRFRHDNTINCHPHNRYR